MTGITVGVCIALICIIICTFIIVCRGKNRYSLCVNTVTAMLTSFFTNSVQYGLFNHKSSFSLSIFWILTLCFFPIGNFQLWKPKEKEWTPLFQLLDIWALTDKLKTLMWPCQWWVKTISLIQRYLILGPACNMAIKKNVIQLSTLKH